jgi:glycosyltransferase involved in cell wall biosynthesis
MPVYNGGEYLRHSIESILSQTYKDFEFLIINNHSTDNSLEIIQSFNDSRITVYSNSVNLGQTKSLNIGLGLAKGRYIVINDADDLSLPHRVETQLDFILKHPEYVVVGTSGFIMDHTGTIKRTYLKHVTPKEIMLSILDNSPIIHGSVIMDKEAILACGGYNEEFKVCQDYELWSSLIRKGYSIINIPDITVIIRLHSNSVSFREKDMQAMENERIIYENITALTNLKISFDEAVRQRLFFTSPQHLHKDKFKGAEELFIEEYKNLRNKNIFGTNFPSDTLKKKLLESYLKFTTAKIEKGEKKEALDISCYFLDRYGFSAMPFVFWIISFNNKMFFDILLALYRKCQAFQSRFSITLIRCKRRLKILRLSEKS